MDSSRCLAGTLSLSGSCPELQARVDRFRSVLILLFLKLLFSSTHLQEIGFRIAHRCEFALFVFCRCSSLTCSQDLRRFHVMVSQTPPSFSRTLSSFAVLGSVKVLEFRRHGLVAPRCFLENQAPRIQPCFSSSGSPVGRNMAVPLIYSPPLERGFFRRSRRIGMTPYPLPLHAQQSLHFMLILLIRGAVIFATCPSKDCRCICSFTLSLPGASLQNPLSFGRKNCGPLLFQLLRIHFVSHRRRCLLFHVSSFLLGYSVRVRACLRPGHLIDLRSVSRAAERYCAGISFSQRSRPPA